MIPDDMDDWAKSLYERRKIVFPSSDGNKAYYLPSMGNDVYIMDIALLDTGGIPERRLLKLRIERHKGYAKATLSMGGNQIVMLHTDHEHTNPGGVNIGRPHKHYLKNGCLKYAYFVDDNFSLKDINEVLSHFLKECNIESRLPEGLQLLMGGN